MIYFIGKYFNSFKQCSQSVEDTMKGKILPVFLTTLSYKYCLCNGQMVNFFKCAKKYTQRETIPFPIKLHPVCLSYKYKYNENALRKLFNFRSVLPFQAAVTFHLIFTIEYFPSLISLSHSTASTEILCFL